MNQLDKQAEGGFGQNHSQPSKINSLIQYDDTNRRKPNLLRINADNQDKKFMCIFWTIFLVFILTFAIVGKTLPSALKNFNNIDELEGTNIVNCRNPNIFENDIVKCGSFNATNPSVSIVTKGLSSLNQFVLFWLTITPKDISVPLLIDQNVTYILYGLQKTQQNGNTAYKRTDLFENETISFQFTSQSTKYVSGRSKQGLAYQRLLGFIGQFPANNMHLSIIFGGPTEQFANVTSFEIEATKISKSFTRFTIGVRYIFFGLSLLAAYLYIRKYRKIPQQDRIIEQKLIMILSIFLIFFNDPFYPITVLKENMVSSFFSTLFVVSFVVYLMFLWVIFFDRIFYEEGQKQTSQIKWYKIIYVIVLFVMLMVLYMMYAWYRLNDHPLIPSSSMTNQKIMALDAIASIVFGVLMLYIIIQQFRICCRDGDMLWRSQMLMAYSILFIVAMMIFVFTDNALGAYHYDGTTVIFLYGLMNLYTWYLQYMYTATKQTQDEIQQKRSIHSDEVMTIGTVQFNDLNINLDDHDTYKIVHKQEDSYKTKNMVEKEVQGGWSRNMNNRGYQNNNDFKRKQQKDEDSFSIQDEQSQKDQRRKHDTNEMFRAKRQENDEQVDFFNESKARKYNASSQAQQRSISNPLIQANKAQSNQSPLVNSTDLLSLNKTANQGLPQQHINHPDETQLMSQPQNPLQVDQQNLQILSEYDQHNNDKQPQNNQSPKKEFSKKEEGFGSFQLQ